MYRQLKAFVCVAMAVLPGTAFHGAVSSARETEAAVEKRVETRQLISKIKTEWDAEKKILDAEAALLKQQIESLEQDIARLQNAATAAMTERRKLETTRDTLRQRKQKFQATLQPLASRLSAVTQRFPKPLLEEVDALRGLTATEAGESYSTSDQLVAILGILRQADRFNRRVTLRKEIQSIMEDRRVQVETLYWGLAFAFAGDRSAQVANFGFPTDEGWRFQPANEHAAATRDLLDTAAGDTESVRFIPLPVELK